MEKKLNKSKYNASTPQMKDINSLLNWEELLGLIFRMSDMLHQIF